MRLQTRLRGSARSPRTSRRRRGRRSSVLAPVSLRNSRLRLPSHRCWIELRQQRVEGGGWKAETEPEGSKRRTYHRVVSKIAECESKNLNGAQSVAGQKAMGVPQLSGSGALAEMSEGMLFRGKNQTEMPLSTHSTARAVVSVEPFTWMIQIEK